jgi:hypothetical protein
MANYHVVHNPKGGWDAKREGASRASSHAQTQRQAEADAKCLAGNSGGGEVRIHSPKGPIRDSDTVKPAKDPDPPKDKKH